MPGAAGVEAVLVPGGMKDPGLVEYVVIAALCKKNKKTVALKNLEKQEAAYYIVWIETVRFLFNMKSHKLIYPGKLVWWITLFGAMLWIASGLVLSLRPAGDPPHTFRTSSDLVPLLALGLILVGVPFGFRMLTYEKEGGRLFKTVCRAVVISSLLAGRMFALLNGAVQSTVEFRQPACRAVLHQLPLLPGYLLSTL